MSDCCLVCDSTSFHLLHPSTFKGTSWEDAVPLFLTHRRMAVHGNIVRCVNCGFVFTTPRFSNEEYAKIYAAVPAGPGPAQHANASRFRYLHESIANICQGGHFMDIGCGDGTFAKGMGSSYRFVGVELGGCTPEQEAPNGRFYRGEFLEVSRRHDQEWKSTFDFITAWDVIEHVPELGDFFSAVHGLLKPGG